MERNLEREKVYDFIKDMQKSCSDFNELDFFDKDYKYNFFKGVKFTLEKLYINDLIRYSDLIQIKSFID